ncbi:transcription termination/antitermination NusG family protein [Methylosinus sp. LW3]|jgi:transcriptional antiterminator RfaH|uniref:transcription termination/antitermination protein NusG n=1 Tax=Methylosinus sp. LW3 TaxID=107635 RepID=UPI0004663F4E|nr:transcription termination/antitermination NusG family protein [Methylosinus sp. LW3]
MASYQNSDHVVEGVSNRRAHGWAVVSTQAHQERLALENLMRQQYHVYCPFVLKRVRHARRTREVSRPLFPGYIFVELAPETRWSPICSTFGVRALVRSGEKPSFLPGDFIDDLKIREIDGVIVAPSRPFEIGQKVRITGGAFHDFIATIIDMDERDRIVVLMELLSRPVKVKLTSEQVDAC